MADIPHFSLPFRFSGPAAAVNEQDSIEEISDCALAVTLCPLGYRVELPSFGWPDPTFSMPLVDVGTLRRAVSRWEPRAALAASAEVDPVDWLLQRINTIVQVQTED